MAGEAGDFLDGYTGVGHERDERVTQLAGGPADADSGSFAGYQEFAADVGGVEFSA